MVESRAMPEGGCDCGKSALEQARGRTYECVESLDLSEFAGRVCDPVGSHTGGFCS